MRRTGLVGTCLIVVSSLLTGCGGDKHGAGGSQGTGGGSGGGIGDGPHSKLMIEACDLALKILAEKETGKSAAEVNKQFEQQVADIDARIAKLPKLSEEQDIKLLQANINKTNEVLKKWGEMAEKGTLNDTGVLLKLPNYALNSDESGK